MQPTPAATAGSGQRDAVLQKVTRWLVQTWSADRSLTWIRLRGLAGNELGALWNDEDVDFLISTLDGDQSPRSPEQLVQRIPGALAETKRRHDQEPIQQEAGKGKDQVGPSGDTGEQEDDPFGDTGEFAEESKTDTPFSRFDFSHEDVAEPEDVPAIWFGPEPGDYSKHFPATANLMAVGKFFINGFEDAAHPSMVLPQLDDSGQEVLRQATAGGIVRQKEVWARFRWPIALVSGEKKAVLAADVRFSYTTQCFVDRRTNRTISVAGKNLEMMRGIMVQVADSAFCSSIVERAMLSFGVTMSACQDGSSLARVNWISAFTLHKQVGGRKAESAGTFDIRGPEGNGLRYTGDTQKCFTLI